MYLLVYLLGHRGAGGTDPSTGSPRAGHQVSVLRVSIKKPNPPSSLSFSTTVFICATFGVWLHFKLYNIFKLQCALPFLFIVL